MLGLERIFEYWILLWVILIVLTKAVDDVHYSHFFKTKDEKKEKNLTGKIITNDSNPYLNFRSSKVLPIKMNRERQVQMEIGIDHSQREKLIPMIDQRNRNEENVNHAMIAGILLRKQRPEHGQPLLMYAHQQRLKAQKTQREMNKIMSTHDIKKVNHTNPKDKTQAESKKRGFRETFSDRKRQRFLDQRRHVQQGQD